MASFDLCNHPSDASHIKNSVQKLFNKEFWWRLRFVFPSSSITQGFVCFDFYHGAQRVINRRRTRDLMFKHFRLFMFFSSLPIPLIRQSLAIRDNVNINEVSNGWIYIFCVYIEIWMGEREMRIMFSFVTVACARRTCVRRGETTNQNMYLSILLHSSNWWNNHWMCLFAFIAIYINFLPSHIATGETLMAERHTE